MSKLLAFLKDLLFAPDECLCSLPLLSIDGESCVLCKRPYPPELKPWAKPMQLHLGPNMIKRMGDELDEMYPGVQLYCTLPETHFVRVLGKENKDGS